MKLGVAVLAIAAACTPPGPGSRDPQPPKPTHMVVTPPSSPTQVQHKSLRAAVEAPHAGVIQVLTATPEGDAVLTIDELGGCRLWPSLDGTKEPRLVDLPQAKQLALAHRGDGYTAVALDETGGLYVAHMDADGRTLAHTTFGVDPPFAGMVMTTAGLVAWRSDHHVFLIDGDGSIQAKLGTEPQQRVVDIATSGASGKVIALLETEGKAKARWLTLQPKAAWGTWLTHADHTTEGVAIALSPDASRFAIATKDAPRVGQVVIYETATGKLINHGALSQLIDVDIEFVDNEGLAIALLSRSVMWLHAKSGTTLANVAHSFVRQRNALAAGGGRALVPREGELMLVTPTTAHFLGYQTLAPQVVAPGPDAKLLLAGVQGAVLLDASLREVSRPNLGLKENTPLATAQWVGGDSWLVESTATNGKLQLALVNASTGATSVLRDSLPEVHYLAYEPATKLVALSFGSQSQLAELDVGKATLVQVTKSVPRNPYEELAYALTDPALARGQQALEVRIRDKPEVRWLKRPTQATSTVMIDGSYLGSDRAGRVYAWRRAAQGKLEVAVYTDGKPTGTLPTQGPASLWPDPTASYVAEAAAGTLTLYRGGSTVWTRVVEGVGEVVWLSDGALAITHASGIARLDAKTGAITAMRCGWEFGLTTKPHPAAPRIEPICTQLAR